MTIEEICLAMQEAERKAGELILHAKGVMTETKSGARDVVTQYDRAVQQLVIWNLRAALPEAHFFCEEMNEQESLDAAQLFIIDPIDGTMNFVRGFSHSCVSVAYAENGVVALKFLRENLPAPSLVILDLHMPELDGYSLLKLIRSDSELRRIPVIVLTSEKGSEVECLQMGASDFITKPYEAPEVVRARVSHSIELAEDSVIIN